MTKKCNRLRGERPKAFWGALVGGAMNLIGSAISSKSQARAIRRQIEAQKEAARTQLELANNSNLASTLNSYAAATRSYNNEDDYNLKYRLGGNKRLGSNRIYITDGGNATKIGNDTYLLRGGSHEQTNETGQTGIGINVGGNEIEAEGGEVAQKKNGAIRIFSAQPILDNGMSPAQAVISGASKDKVFNAQQRFKKNNGIKDDGSKAQVGGYYGANYPSPLSLLSVLYDKTLGRFDDKNPFLQTGIAPTPSRALNLKQVRGGLVNRNMLRTNRVYRIANMREVKDAKAIGQYRKLPEGVTLPTKTVRTRSGRTFEFGKAGGNSHGGKAAAMGEPWTGTTSGGYNESKYIISTPSRHTTWNVGHGGNYSKPLPADAIKKGSGLWKKFDADGNTGISTKRMLVYKDLGNGRYLRLTKSKYRLGGLTSKDRGSSKHPYPSVSSKDFAGGGRSYPIPTKADAVDALRLAGLHGRSDIKTKVYSRYPELRPKARIGGSWTAPVYNTNKYRVSNRMRRQIATWEGSDFAGQNRRFKGDAIGAKERELRRMMGRTYNYLNDNQRDSLNSIYYNSRVDTFKNAFGKWFRNLNNAVDRGDERAFNNSLAGIRQSMTVGANRKGMSGLAKRRAWEQDWFGNPIPMDSNETKAILKQQAESRMAQPTDNTRVVIQPEYIEVPAPVGHGVVPVDNPDPNLLQGNIKDNLINMGNKFRLGQRCGGSTRMRKALGGESRPVKGMRSKLAWGDVVYPYRRNNNFDYWTIIDQEQKANDKGGVTPWTTSNRYDVKVPYAITKSTPTIPYTSQVTTPTSKVSTNNTIPTYIGNKSGMILRDADWYGLGADLVSSIGGSILGLGAYKNLDFNYNLPNFVEESPVALNTTYHNEAQKSNVERNRLNSRNSILRNTMSGSTAVGRMQGVDTNALYQLNQLADEKTNKETELMNQNLLNEQQVRARNAAARNQYYNTVASIKNAAIQAKNEAELAKGQILSGTLQGIGNSFQNLISQGRQNYDDTQAMLMGVAASDYATPSRLLELGVDVGDDAALAGIYRSAMNIPNPGARPKREDYSDNTEYSYALTRWENQNKAYQRRNSYADLIKGRMSKKNLIKYGII